VSLQRGPISHVNTIEELLEIKSSGSGLENREYSYTTLHPLSTKVFTKFADKRLSLGIIPSFNQVKQFFFVRACVCVCFC
jgi:hypothetical protein